MTKKRILQLIDNKGITKTIFFQRTGLKRGFLDADKLNQAVSDRQIAMIIAAFPDVNLEWLITGNGDELRKIDEGHKENDIILVPVLNLDARGGFGPNDVTDTPQATLRYIPFEKNVARQGDIVLPVFGDSMSPQYPAGTLILIRAYDHWREYIDYGNAFVVELDDDSRFIKIVNKASTEGRVLLHSVNPAYEDSEVPVSIIRRMYRVVLSMRQETM